MVLGKSFSAGLIRKKPALLMKGISGYDADQAVAENQPG